MLPNKRKELVLQTTSINRMWLTLISGLTGFTEREIDVLEVILKKRQELIAQGIKQPYLSQLLFSTESRKEYHTILGITEYNFTNLFGSIKKKKGITKGDNPDLDTRLIPENEMVIKFILINDTGTDNREEDSNQ